MKTEPDGSADGDGPNNSSERISHADDTKSNRIMDDPSLEDPSQDDVTDSTATVDDAIDPSVSEDNVPDSYGTEDDAVDGLEVDDDDVDDLESKMNPPTGSETFDDATSCDIGDFSQPGGSIDLLERQDFEEENRLISQCSGVIVDARRLVSPLNDSQFSSANLSDYPSASTSRSVSNLNNLSVESNPCVPSCSRRDSPDLNVQPVSSNYPSTPINFCRKKNEIFKINITPPKPIRPSNIPKFKLEEAAREEIDKNETLHNSRICFQGTCSTSGTSHSDNDRSFVNERSNKDLSDSKCSIDNDANVDACRLEQVVHPEEPGHSGVGVGNAEESVQPDIAVDPAMPMFYPPLLCCDYEDPDSGEEEEEAVCTCSNNREAEVDQSFESRLAYDSEPSFVDYEHSLIENSPRSQRKRKNDSPPSCYSASKKIFTDVDNQNVSNGDSPPDVRTWLTKFTCWTGKERLQAIDMLIKQCTADQISHMMQAIEPLFQRDFISLLPKELALAVLGFLEPKDLLNASQTCRSWRFLADDNLLWKEQCRREGIENSCVRLCFMPTTTSPWKRAYMRHHLIEANWLTKPIGQPKILKGHDDHVITCLQYSENKILSGSDDTTLKLWSAITGKCLRTLVGHTGGVWSSQMVGRTIISGSTDRTLRVWDALTGTCLRMLTGHTSTVRCMHLFNDVVVSGSRDATLRIWNVTDGHCMKVLIGHRAAVRCVQYDGRLVVSGAYDYLIKVWSPETGECLRTLAGHTNRVYSLQFDGVHVVSGSLDTTIIVWDVETGNLKHTLRGHRSLTSGMELRSNTLVSGNADSTVKVWNIISGQCLHTLSGPNKHQSAVTSLQSNGRFVITSSDDGTVKLWDLKTGEFIRNLISLDSGGSGGVVWRIRATPSKLVCAVGSRNGTEETKLMVLNFNIPGACLVCDA